MQSLQQAEVPDQEYKDPHHRDVYKRQDIRPDIFIPGTTKYTIDELADYLIICTPFVFLLFAFPFFHKTSQQEYFLPIHLMLLHNIPAVSLHFLHIQTDFRQYAGLELSLIHILIDCNAV